MTQPMTFIPAATVVIFRHGQPGQPAELLMVQRAKALRFAGGAAVFPGGKVDPADRDLAAAIDPDGDPQVAAARIAGVRETLEETGLAIGLNQSVTAAEALAAREHLLQQGSLGPVLNRFGWTLNLDALVPFAHWCPQREGSFDTRFFLADLGTGAVDISVDATENTRLFWASAADALRLADSEDISVIFPTRRNLERLAQFDSFAETAVHARNTPVRRIAPAQVARDGELFLTIPEDLGYPVCAQSMATVMRG